VKKNSTATNLTVPKRRAMFPNANGQKREAAPFSVAGIPVEPGDIFLGEQSHNGYVRVERFGTAKAQRWVAKGKNGKDKTESYDKPVIFFRKYVGAASVEHEMDDEKRAKAPLRDWSSQVYSDEQDDFAKYYGIRVTGTISEFEAAALKRFLSGPDPKETEESTETGLQAMSEVRALFAIERMVFLKQNDIDAMNRVMESKLHAFQITASAMAHQMERIRQAIGFLETYLGTWQKVYIIAEGQPAPATEPISIRQLILFMDEECGDPRLKLETGQRGIDWQSVDDFDAWVTAGPANLQKVLPEIKGVVAIRPSRQEREYSNDWREQAQMERNNRMAYLLIRNGENIYRIWLGDTLGQRLFPTLNEFHVKEDDPFAWSRQDRMEAIKFGYQGNMALIQGIMDRTEIFKPLPHYINLNQSETWAGLINLIRDAETGSLLGDSHPRWENWKREINSKIVRGSRVFFGPEEGHVWGDGRHHHFVAYYSKNSGPPGPPAGIYTAEGKIFPDKIRAPEEREHFDFDTRKSTKYMSAPGDGYRLFIQYNPRDTIYNNGWSLYDKNGDWIEPHERKNRVSWWLDINRPQVLNYDLITLEDIEFFLESRLDRHHFLDMIVTLWSLRDELRKELAWEKQFVQAMAGRLECDESLVWDAVHWWKTKVIHTRALNSDDKRAWKMIERRVRRMQENSSK